MQCARTCTSVRLHTHTDNFLVNKPALCGILTVMHSALNLEKTLLGKYHFMLYTIACSITPRLLVTVDEDLNALPVNVRVGQSANQSYSINQSIAHSVGRLVGDRDSP